eukprot:713058-Prymnesium_polylepis.1
MFTARVACEPGGRVCATVRKSWCAAPNVFHVHTPAIQTLNTFRGAETEPGAADVLQEHGA